MRYQARAPLRIDFGGGWTDVPIFALAEGGAVLNAAITRYVIGSISRPSPAGLIGRLRSDRSYLNYSLDVPSGAGLGASAAQTVLWATLVRTTIANTADRREVAEIAWGVSGLLGMIGGKQDEYASALGGINYLTFGESVSAERLDLDAAFRETLRSHLVLVYTGQRRNSSEVHQAVWQRYREGNAEVVGALRSLKRLAGEMKSTLLAHDLPALGDLLTEHWKEQQQLDPSVNTPTIDSILDFARSRGAAAGKACGAGGGGCVLLLARSGEGENLRAALQRRRLHLIDFDFDTYGVFLKKA